MKAHIQVQDAIATAIASTDHAQEDLVSVYAFLRPEENGHPARWEVYIEPVDMQELDLNFTIVQVNAETGDVIAGKPPHITQDSESFSSASYSPRRATKRPDGTISVPAGGANDQGIWDGFLEAPPNHADYEFWQWLLKRWPYRSQLSSEDIPTLKEEFAKGVV